MSHYANRNIRALGAHYSKHVEAMTVEGLHEKSEIAAELAHRDVLIDRLQETCGWQPISTVPRDGSPLLVTGPHFKYPQSVTWNNGALEENWNSNNVEKNGPVTHWMPLPKPPEDV